jgi:hypothetical protein
MLAVRAPQDGCWIASVTEVARRNETISAVVVLDDRASRVEDPRHRQSWADWLHWANVLQFLNGEQRTADFVTTTTDWDPAELLPGSAEPGQVVVPGTTPTASVAGVAGVAGAAAPNAPLPAAWERLRRVADSPAVESLIMALGRDGRLAVPDIGLDVGDDNEWMVELAWQDEQGRLAVVTDSDEQRDTWLANQGWRTVLVSDDNVFDQITTYLIGGSR